MRAIGGDILADSVLVLFPSSPHNYFHFEVRYTEMRCEVLRHDMDMNAC
jgi:hypothetical protein